MYMYIGWLIEMIANVFCYIRFEFGEGLDDWMIEVKLCDISA